MQSIIFRGQIEAIYKIIVIGDPDVGKTSLLEKYASNQFKEKYLPTVGVSISKDVVELEDRDAIVSLMFWDIAAQPQFYDLYRLYFNGADGMILVFDITRSSTFNNINNWYNLAVKFGLSRIPIIIIGNKVHLEYKRSIIQPMAEHLSQKLNATYVETSNITGQNVKNVFKKIAELVYLSKLHY
jgi:small GTP-binding protein